MENELENKDILLLAEISHIPLFWGADPNAMEIIEAAGHTVYYILANHKEVEVVNSKAVTSLTPTMFRVEKSFLGRIITTPEQSHMDLSCDIVPNAYYHLPKMPYEFTRKIDAFFRKVHKIHGTESILVLTFDPNYLGTDNPGGGWGCIAPKQEDTAMDCSYEMDSVMQVKPPHVNIVGTWHSHPEMSAFFSGTDHKDQDDWDGIHITSGWKGSGPTEFYIAMIGGGKNWTYDPIYIFDTPPAPVVDLAEIDTWIENVSKKTYTHVSSTNYSHGTYGGSSHSSINSLSSGSSTTAALGKKVRAIVLPSTAPDPRLTTIIAKLNLSAGGNIKCPFCSSPLSPSSINTNRCLQCRSHFIDITWDLNDLKESRANKKLPYLIELDPERSESPIVFWLVADATHDDHFTTDLRTIPKA